MFERKTVDFVDLTSAQCTGEFWLKSMSEIGRVNVSLPDVCVCILCVCVCAVTEGGGEIERESIRGYGIRLM